MPNQRSLLKELLAKRHLTSRAAFAGEYDKVARGLGKNFIGSAPSAEQFKRWLTCKVKTLPRADHCRVLEKMFPGYSAEELLSPYDPIEIPAGDDRPHVQEETTTNRRAVFRIGAGAVAAGLVESVWTGPDLLEKVLDSGSVGEGRLLHLEQEARRLGQKVVKVPPASLLQETMLNLAGVQDLLGQRQPADAQQRLARVGAQLATVVGEILFNSNHFGLARRWYRAANRAAQEAGDRYLGDIALAGGAYLPTYDGEPREVLAHVLPRLEQGPSPSPAVAWLWGFAAKAYAALGDRAAFERAIEASRTALERSSPGTVLPGIFSFLPEKLSFYEARGRGDLGDADGAAAAASRALADYDLTDTTEPALVRFEHASALAKSGELREAYRIAFGAVSDEHTFHSASVVTRAREFGNLLDPRSQTGRDWREVLANLQLPDVSIPALPSSRT
ncbi:hypothetical protein OG339_22350 [Streptosporangium sp. NBC_01495]|uniref:hypothetical protein n=1 Tax=Streptosporangium sp. NBC_01495 TaxID=2903899 RepID=UPI002E30FA3F|nr:hypothetical protein [Streptosporangium sp. NBC_01495]